MIEKIKYLLKLKKLRNAKGEISKRLTRLESIQQTADTIAEANSLFQDEEKVMSWIEYLQTQYYHSVCHKLIIPIPKFESENYYKYDFDDNNGERYILSSNGFYIVRQMIRTEKKERREFFSFWVIILFGLIGAITGLVAVFKT